MEEKAFYTLKIDPVFRCLIRPLQKRDYKRLESSILEKGCLSPVLTWNGYIVDGHNRYNICREHEILFSIEKAEFDCREDIISWICEKQLVRKDIAEEQRKYLIGMQYIAEKAKSSRKSSFDDHQYSNTNDEYDLPYDNYELCSGHSRNGHINAIRIGDKNHVSWNTVYKYSIYARAIESIRRKAPSIVVQILSGRCKISHNSIIELSHMRSDQIKKVAERLEHGRISYVQYKNTRKEIRDSVKQGAQNLESPPSLPSVKDMPEFDPDSELTSLALTIPSWAGSIKRALEKTDFEISSKPAKQKVADALQCLTQAIDQIMFALKED